MATGYHISNTKILKVSFDNLSEGFWIAHSLRELLNCGDYCGASIINSKPLYIHKVQYDDGRSAGWDEYDNLMIDQIINKGFTVVNLTDTSIILTPESIKRIKVIQII